MLLAALKNERGHAQVIGLGCSLSGSQITISRLIVQDAPRRAGFLRCQITKEDATTQEIKIKLPRLESECQYRNVTVPFEAVEKGKHDRTVSKPD
jgi:hypothetical protein